MLQFELMLFTVFGVCRKSRKSAEGRSPSAKGQRLTVLNVSARLNKPAIPSPEQKSGTKDAMAFKERERSAPSSAIAKRPQTESSLKISSWMFFLRGDQF